MEQKAELRLPQLPEEIRVPAARDVALEGMLPPSSPPACLQTRSLSLKPKRLTAETRGYPIVVAVQAEGETGISPEAVARLLEHILRRWSPRLRYPVANASQRFAAVGKKLMPSGLFERLLTRYYRKT